MNPRLSRVVRASVLAERLGMRLEGADVEIDRVSSLSNAGPGALVFATKCTPFVPRGACVISTIRPGMPQEWLDRVHPPASWLESRTPRLAFVKALRILQDLVGFALAADLNDTLRADIDPTARLGRGVIIGEGTRIESHVRIADNVRIGRDCWIKSGAVIGEDGFGFERDTDGTPIRMLHFGGVVIGDHVEIGSLTTVCQGTLEPTVIEDHAKIDDHVHVAHNCRIGTKAMVIAHAELSGGVVVGEQAWVGPRACVREQVKIGEHAFIGLGAVVLMDVAPGTTVVGNPARVLERKTQAA